MGERDQVISDYVRFRIREWRKSGRQLQELALRARIAKSSPSQVLQGTGVAAKTGAGYARVFVGPNATYRDLQERAYDWWREQGAGADAVTRSPQDAPALAEALDFVRDLKTPPEGQLRAIVAAYSADRFRDRDRDWWIRTLLSELEEDRKQTVDERTTEKAAKKVRKKVREGNAAIERARTEPPPPPKVDGKRKAAS